MQIFKEIEHKADIGIEIYGNSINQLFAHALIGFYCVLLDVKNLTLLPKSDSEYLMSLTENSAEILLVTFLNELNYLFLVKKVILFPVKNLEIDQTMRINLNLKASEISNISNELLENATEIKAVTYHQLKIEKIDGRFIARIIFDV